MNKVLKLLILMTGSLKIVRTDYPVITGHNDVISKNFEIFILAARRHPRQEFDQFRIIL